MANSRVIIVFYLQKPIDIYFDLDEIHLTLLNVIHMMLVKNVLPLNELEIESWENFSIKYTLIRSSNRKFFG